MPTSLIPPHPAIAPIRDACLADDDVASAFLLGSVARGEAIARSDLDVSIIARKGCREAVAERVVAALAPAFTAHFAIPAKGKRVLFSGDLRRKVDLFVIEDLTEVARYVAGSRISDPAAAVLCDRTGELAARLAALDPEPDDLDARIDEHLTRFASFFEAASAHHARTDMYRAFFDLHVAIQSIATLAWLAQGRRGFLWAPPDLARALPADFKLRFADLSVGMRPDTFHAQKVGALARMREVATLLGRADDARLGLCDAVLSRDRFWNYRDAAAYVDDRLATGVLLRGSSPHRYASEPDYARWLVDHHVAVRIDLRGRREKEVSPAGDLGLRVVEAPVDPWLDFAPDDPLHDGVDGHEAAYRFTALRCGHAVAAVVDAVAAGEGGVLVHCQAGRDRTGVVVALAQLLVGVGRDAALAGYSAASTLAETQMCARVLELVDLNVLAAAMDPDRLATFRARMWR